MSKENCERKVKDVCDRLGYHSVNTQSPHLPLQVVYFPALWLWSWPCVLLFQWYVWEYDRSRSLKYTNTIGFPLLHISFSSWVDSGGHWPKENERYLEQTGSNLQLEAKPSPAQPILYQSQANCRHITNTKQNRICISLHTTEFWVHYLALL